MNYDSAPWGISHKLILTHQMNNFFCGLANPMQINTIRLSFHQTASADNEVSLKLIGGKYLLVRVHHHGARTDSWANALKMLIVSPRQLTRATHPPECDLCSCWCDVPPLVGFMACEQTSAWSPPPLPPSPTLRHSVDGESLAWRSPPRTPSSTS